MATASGSDMADFVDISPNSDRGILKKVIKEGISDIKPCKKDTVYVHYVGTFLGGEKDGEKFDSSRDRDDKFSFTLMGEEVIKSWDICVATMRIGEVCEMITSPEYAYKDGETRKFEIELFSCEGEDVSPKHDKSVRKSILKEGEGHSNPCGASSVTISYERLIPSGKNSPKESTYIVGDYVEAKVPKGVDVAVRSMLLNEEARIQFKSEKSDELSFGDNNDGGLLTYLVTVKDFEKIKRINSFPKFEEQLAYATTLKDKANQYIKVEKYGLALEMYERINSDISYIVPHGVPETKSLDSFKVTIFNNMALCFLKLNDPEACIKSCNDALEIDFKSEKALFRKGQAEVLRNDPEEAVKCFASLKHYYPENKAGIQQLNMCKSTINKMNNDVKRKFRNIFKKCEDTGLGVVDNVPIAAPESESESESEEMADPAPEKTVA